ncbi:MAG: tRNA dihydrouridine synthase DusB [Deltaproteobacteria bacterium]|jgi:nifR3 family TIM-barrel protein|nr:tRNA dihydrouridine synthase DusB [Deltaproteobacteria bacterium]
MRLLSTSSPTLDLTSKDLTGKGLAVNDLAANDLTVNDLAANSFDLKIGSIKLDNPFIVAPMAGLTDWPYRRLCLEEGASLAVTEMASAVSLAHQGRKTLALLASDRAIEKHLCVQLFGKDPATMAEAAKVAVFQAGASMIDLNFGCPARKVVRSGHGGALLRDPDLCLRIVEAVASCVSVPVTVKTRPGFAPEDGPIILSLAKKYQQAGAAAITLHPRYVTCAFTGQADWSLIDSLADAVTIPVIGSGDIKTPEAAVSALKSSGASGVMIGRASRGCPWFFRQCLEILSQGIAREITPMERLNTALLHARLLRDLIGPKAAFRLRTVLTWYTRELPGAAALRSAICREDNVDKQMDLLTQAFLGFEAKL